MTIHETGAARINALVNVSKRHAKAHFCSMCGPQFCSMKLSHEVRALDSDAVAVGMAEKAKEFKEKGGKIYV